MHVIHTDIYIYKCKDISLSLYIYIYTVYIYSHVEREREYTSRNKHSRTDGSCPKFLFPETAILSQVHKTFSPHPNLGLCVGPLYVGKNEQGNRTRGPLEVSASLVSAPATTGPFSDRLLFAPVTARTGLSSETSKTPRRFSDAHPSVDG